MKKLLYSIIFCLLAVASEAQTTSTYAFSTSTGTLTSIIGLPGTVSSTSLNADDAKIQDISLGFNFIFCGTTYSTVSACSNGWISLANSASTTYSNTAANIPSAGFLMAFWDDLSGSSGATQVYYQTSGTSPSRVFTFQWGDPTNGWPTITGSGKMLFQIKLYESSNVIEYRYASSSSSALFSGASATIGIANSSSDLYVLANSSSTTPQTTFSSGCTTSPTANTMMRWTPGPTINVTPSSMTFSTSVSTTAASQNATLVAYGLTAGSVTITAPANFQVFDGSTWVSSMSVSTSAAAVGTYINTTIPVRFNAPAATGTSTGNLSFASTGATTKNIALTGNALPVCSGTPVAGTTTATTLSGLCTSPYATTLSLVAATSGVGGLTYQWQSSPDGITAYTNIVGATNATYATTVSANIFYRARVTCSISSLSDTSGAQNLAYTAAVPAVTGTRTLCPTTTTTLANTASFGTWSSSNTGVATVTLNTGIVSGVAAGTSNITYMTYTGCYAVAQVTVNSLPTVTASASPGTLCIGGNSALTGFTPLPTNYNLTAIPHATVSFAATGTLNSGTTPSAGSNDDGYYTISMPFSFTLYGTVYSSVNIGTNGMLMFGGGSTSTSIGTIPNSSFPATIALFGRDMNLGTGGSITYGTTGTAPNRVFIVYYNNVPDFSTGLIENGQIMLYETTNSIQLHITTAAASSHTVGVQSNAGGTSLVVPGQNASSTAITASAWQFDWPVITYNWSPATYLSSNTVASPTVNSPASTTTYTLTAVGINGCPNTATALVSVNPLPAVIGGPTSVCTGSNITLTNATSGGTWSSPSSNVTVGASNGAITGNTAGTALISYTLASGCRVTTTVTINQTPPAITGTTGVCNGLTATLANATGVVWTSANSGIASVNGIGVVTGVSLGTTTITVYNTNGCFNTTTVSVNVQPAVITGTATACIAGNTTLSDATGGGVWSSASANASVSSSGAVTGLVVGTATISYTIASCASTKVVTVNPVPGAIGGTPAACVGATTLLSNSATGGTWSSSNGNATIDISSGIMTGSAAGNSTITYMLPAGCFTTVAATVNPVPGPITGTAVACVNGTANLANSVGGGAWTSSSTATASVTGGVVSGAAAGTATITYTLPAGCYTTRVATINALPAPFTVSGGGGNCAGAAGVHIQLNASATGINYMVYNGSSSASSSFSGTNALIDFGLFTTDGTYTVRATDATTGCVNAMSGSATVVTWALPTVYDINGGGSYCNGGAGMPISMDVTDPGINYMLKLGSTLINTVGGTGADISFGNVYTAGTYSVQAVDAVTGCTNAMNNNPMVVVNALPVAYNVTGGGNVCGGSGLPVNLDNAEAGITYELRMGSTAITSTTPASSGGFTFGNQTANGVYSVHATNAGTGCQSDMNGSATVTFYPNPTVFNVGGGGSYCNGTGGVHVTLDGSQTGVRYQLYNGSSMASTPVDGTNSTLDFGLLTADGIYTVVATDLTTACVSNMSSFASVTTLTLPVVQTVTGGGSYCNGAGGVSIDILGTEAGYIYDIYNGSTPAGSITGNGSPMSFGMFTADGIYTVRATSPASCVSAMNNSASVVTNALPVVQNASGGGSYCFGTGGMEIVLDASEAGTHYQLYNGTSPVGTFKLGTGGILSFGMLTVDGIYSVRATSVAGCVSDMTGNPGIITLPLPNVSTFSGGGIRCDYEAGFDLVLNPTQTNTNYQLYNGANPVGAPVPGTGSSIDFGVMTAGGIYTVRATSTITGCVNNMAGSANITVNERPTVYDITGGGHYCAGGTGMSVGLSSSQSGINYQLRRGSVAVATMAGGSGAIDFGLQTVAGAYHIVAINSTTGCENVMNGATDVIIDELPEPYYVTGGGAYCQGGLGRLVGVSNSQTGITYSLYRSSGFVADMPGSGLQVDYGAMTTAGTYTVRATNNTTGCISNMIGSVSVSINPLPDMHTVSGTGSYCQGGAGVHVMQDLADVDVFYQLYRGSTPVGSAIEGTGTPLDFGAMTDAGTYTVKATMEGTGCARNLSGSAVISINPLPDVRAVTGGGAYCNGTGGVHIGIDGQNGINYQLYLGGSTVSSIINGTGAPIDFGLYTTAGTYTVLATDAVTSCAAVMSGAAVVSINQQPIVYSVMGSGNNCAGSIGLDVYLSHSDMGITYQLYRGATPIGSIENGNGSELHFGPQAVAGTYTVMANPATTCTTPMTGSAVITVSALPTAYNVIGGGSYCAGGTGVSVSMFNTTAGVSYQLYNGTATAGLPQTSLSGGPLSFGLQTAAGTYTVLATDLSTNCKAAMSTSASVSITPLVTPSVTVTSTSGGSVCEGQMASFVAAPVNGGTTPMYTWTVNGDTVGLDSLGFTYTPTTGDVVAAILTSNAACATPATAMSAGVAITVVNNVTPSVTITNDKGTEVCISTPVTFTAAPLFAGTTPGYKWLKGTGASSIVVGTGLTYTYMPADGDVIYFVEASSLACVTAPEVYSNVISMTVDSPYVPAVDIIAYPGQYIKEGTSDTLYAVVANAGPHPTFQWSLNGTPIAGATEASYVSANFHDGDSVSVDVKGSGVCGLHTFNALIVHTSPVGVVSVGNGMTEVVLVPNPNKGDFFIKGALGTSTDTDVDVELTDMLGQVVYNSHITAKQGRVDEHIRLSNTLANGMYMLNLRAGNEHKVFHMVLEQ